MIKEHVDKQEYQPPDNIYASCSNVSDMNPSFMLSTVKKPRNLTSTIKKRKPISARKNVFEAYGNLPSSTVVSKHKYSKHSSKYASCSSLVPWNSTCATRSDRTIQSNGGLNIAFFQNIELQNYAGNVWETNRAVLFEMMKERKEQDIHTLMKLIGEPQR